MRRKRQASPGTGMPNRREITAVFLFDTSDGRELDPSELRRRLDAAVDKAGADCMFVQRDATYVDHSLTAEFQYQRPRGWR